MNDSSSIENGVSRDLTLDQQISPPVSEKPRRSKLLVLGGWMTLAAGILALVNGLRAIIAESPIALGPEASFTKYTACGIMVILFGIVAVAGGICALRGRNFTLALAGAVFGILGGGLFGFYLGFGALVVFGLSNEDLSS